MDLWIFVVDLLGHTHNNFKTKQVVTFKFTTAYTQSEKEYYSATSVSTVLIYLYEFQLGQ